VIEIDDRLPPSLSDRAGGAARCVAERGHAVAIGAGRPGHATGAIVERGHAVGVGSGAAGGAAVGVAEANVLRVDGRGEREQQKRDGIQFLDNGRRIRHSE